LQRRLKVRMGPALAPFVGIPTGRYDFDSTVPLQRHAIERLLAIDKTEADRRKE
jgi:hypothetical protein